jgi:protein-S-isoprenylcysteine O-methyltransferase Ste14
MALQEECEKQGNFLFKYRGILPLILLGTSLAVFIHAQYYDTARGNIISFNNLLLSGLAVSFAGFIIRIITVGYSASFTSGRNTDRQVADELNTTGIYSIVRHPLYLGNFLMWLGPAIVIQKIWFIIAFILAFWVYYERIMFAEEQFLRRKFGEFYLKWAEKTPAFIISLKNYTPAITRFSWKKVLRKEKNGFVAVFIVFYVFNSIREYILHQVPDTSSWLLYALVFSIIFYIIIKSTLKFTSFFDSDW